jgi:hypothetical protein
MQKAGLAAQFIGVALLDTAWLAARSFIMVQNHRMQDQRAVNSSVEQTRPEPRLQLPLGNWIEAD